MDRTITLTARLDDEQYKALKRLASSDRRTIEEEARLLFYLQLREEIWLEEDRKAGRQ